MGESSNEGRTSTGRPDDSDCSPLQENILGFGSHCAACLGYQSSRCLCNSTCIDEHDWQNCVGYWRYAYYANGGRVLKGAKESHTLYSGNTALDRDASAMCRAFG